MKIENTKLKLEEAEFFLKNLENSKSKRKEFNFYLNAFVSSARSVTWVMRAEFQNLKEWENWFKKQTPPFEERELLKYFNELRIETIKRKPLKTSTQIEINIPANEVTEELKEQLEKMEGKKGLIYFATNEEELKDVNGFLIGKNITIENVFLRVNNVESDYEIISACQKYFDSLKRLVNNCEKKFTTSNSK